MVKVDILQTICIYKVLEIKDQKLVGCFVEDSISYRLLISISLKMYRKFG